MLIFGWQRATSGLNCFNLACGGATSARRIAEIVCEEMHLQDVVFDYSGGSRGWVGDVSQVRLDPAKLAALGWQARLDSDGAVRQAVRIQLASAARAGRG